MASALGYIFAKNQNNKIMADYNSTATSTIYVNGKPAEAELQKLKQRASDLRDAIASAAKAGDKASLKKLRSELNQTKREVKEVEGAMHAAEVVMKRLDKATPKELQATLLQLKKELNDMERGTDAWDKQVAKIKQVKAALDDVNNEMKEQESLLSRVKNGINGWGMSIAAAAAAITGLTMTIRQAVEAYAEMEQEEANVRKYTGMTAEQVESLNDEFKNMDTRTGRGELNQLAQEAGRLGLQSKEDVLGFVKAADKINVALDDLGDGATLTLSKLTGIFGDQERYGVEQSLLKTGSVINELSQNCAASAPYIAEFASRMGGVGAQAGMSVQQIMGLAAVLDSNNQKVEASATAVSQVITRLYQDPAKYAKVAGLDVQNFTKLLKEDANAALIQLLETLNKQGGLDKLAPMFKDMGENGARAISALSTLATHIDEVKVQQDVANRAFEEGTSIQKEFNVQNNTVQAGLDKAKKKFQEMVIELGQKLAPAARYAISGTSALMRVLSAGVSFIASHKGAMISLVATITAYTVAVKMATIAKALKNAKDAIGNTLDKVGTLLTNTRKIATYGLAAAYNTVTGNATRAAAATRSLNAAISSTGWGAIIALIGTAITAVMMFTSKTKEASKAQQEFEQFTKDLDDTRKQYQETLDKEKRKITDLVAVARDDKVSMEQRQKAIDALNRIIPNYCAKLDAETGKYYENKKALDDYLLSLERKIRLEANRAEYEKLIAEDERLSREIDQAETYTRARYQGSVDKGWDYESRSTIAHVAGASIDPKGNVTKAPDSKQTKTLKSQQAVVRAKIKKLVDYAGKENLVLADVQAEPNAPTITDPSYVPGGGGGGSSSTKRSGRGGGSSSKNTDKFAAEKAWREREDALNRIAYATGAIEYEQYTLRMSEIAQQFYQKQLQHKDLTENEKLSISAQYAEEAKKEEELRHKQALATQEKEFDELRASVMQDYIDNKISKSEYDMENIEYAHLHALVAIAEEGSDERLKAEANLRKKLLEGVEKRNKDIEDKQREHQQKLAELYKQYFTPSEEEKQALYDSTAAYLDEIYQNELAKIGDDNEKKLELEKRYLAAKKKLHDEIFAKEEKDNQERGKNWEQWTQQWLDKIFGEGTWEKYGGFITSAVSSITATWQNLTKLVEAEEKAKLAAMTKKYDAEIKAAEGNQYRVNQIQKRKEAEEKRIKDAANKRAMAMEMAQAISSNALGAINAYASAAKAPWPLGMVLGPIAAGLALSAGLIQIAAIRKQHAAQAQGYAEGGFTGPGGKYEPAGIVHAGEWVASQALLANPVARPVINMLDYAQRTNTIGRLGAGGAAAAPVVMTESAELRAVIVRLNERLNEPFVTVNTVTGDHGIKKAMDDYNKLQNNTLPKNKRT